MTRATASDSAAGGNSDEVDLGDDSMLITFKIGNKSFQCFPFDELQSIEDSIRDDPAKQKGEPFLSVIQSHLQSKFAINASLAMCGKWYDSLHLKHQEQIGFFEQSSAAGDSSGNSPAATDDASAGQIPASDNGGSSKSPRKKSKRKN